MAIDATKLVGRRPDGTPYISPSQVRELLTCPERWRRKYQEDEDDPIGVDAVVGFAVDEALTAAAQHRIDTDEWLPALQVAELAEASVDAKLENAGIHWETEPTEADRDELRLEAWRLAPLAWQWLRYGSLDPVRVQGWATREMQGGAWAINGRYDLLARDTSSGELVLVDWKTVNRSPSTGDAGRYQAKRYYQYQLLGYVAGLHADAEPVEGAWICHIVRNKTPKVCWAPVPVTGETISWALNLYVQAARIVDLDLLHPNPVGAGWKCSPDYCAFWDDCPGAAHHEQEGP